MQKKILVGLMICIILLSGCGVNPRPNTLATRRGTQTNTASPSSKPVQGDKAADSSAPLSKPAQKNEAGNTSASSHTLTPETQDDGEIIAIKEKMFIAQCSDINLNPEDYKGKNIKLEGMYDEYTDTQTNKTYRYVYRNSPGCCGNDGVVGFEILYDGSLPKLNDWIEVTGKVEIVKEEEYDYEYVVLRVSKLAVLDKRGAEFVSN